MSAQHLAEAERTREAADPFCVSDAQADELLLGAPWRRLVIIGDSLAEGVGDESPGYRSSPWPERLRDALRRQQPGLEYVNLGKRGLLAAEVREGQLQEALDFQPDLAAVVCGGNDLLVEHFDPDAVTAEIDALVAPLRQAGADVVTWTLQDITLAWPALANGPLRERLRTLNERVAEVSERHGAILVDQRSLAAAAEQDVYSQDLMHASMRGHAIVAAQTIARLSRHLRATVA
jgi:lysophospholipase L1-like esterase